MGAAERVGARLIRLSELSLSSWPPERRIMAALTGYFDDSRTDGLIFTVAGYVGGQRHWEIFDDLWPAVLARFEVPYFHMKEFGDPDGPYRKWLPYPDHRKEISSFLGALARAISGARLKGFGSIIRLKDLARFNKEKRLALEPYALAVYGSMIWIGKQNPSDVISLIFDRIEQVSSRLEKATEYADSDIYYAGVCDRIQLIPLNKSLGAHDVPALQAQGCSVL